MDQKPIILLVDDESTLRSILADMLTAAGYTCITAANGVDALRIVESDLVAIDLMVSDVRMPGTINGVELADQIRQSRPWTAVILISGYTTEGVGQEIRAKGYRLLEKPFRQHQLEAAVREELGRRPAAASVVPLKRERDSG